MDFSKIPFSLLEQAKKAVQRIHDAIGMNGWSLCKEDFIRIGHEKRGYITVTCRINGKYGCLVCGEAHKTMLFRYSLKQEKITLFCRKTRKQEEVFECDILALDAKVPKSITQFTNLLALFRKEHQIRAKLEQKINSEDKGFLESLISKDAVFGDGFMEPLHDNQQAAITEMKRRVAKPVILASDLFKVYKQWHLSNYQGHCQMGLEKFTAFTQRDIPLLVTENAAAKLYPCFNLNQIELAPSVLGLEVYKKLSKILF